MQPTEDPALPEQPASSSAGPLNILVNPQDAVIFDGMTGYAEFGDDFDDLLVSPPYKKHYAIPFDVSDDTDLGKHDPKTVGRSGYFSCSIVLTIWDRSLRCECAQCPRRSGRSRVGGRR